MKKRSKLIALACFLVALLPLLAARAVAGDAEFQAIVDRVSTYYHKRPMPFMGLLSFTANRFNPHGVNHLSMAIFEDVDSARMPPAEETESFLQDLVGASYQPMVRVYDNHSGEQTFIYAREGDKNNFEMLIVSLERTEAVIIKMRLDPDAMRDWVGDPVRKGHNSAHAGVTSAAR
jgi:hypothetical protein